jgi:hypothetical protein
MRRLLVDATLVGAITVTLFALADGAASLLIILHKGVYAGTAAARSPDAYFTSANHAWPPEYFTELSAVSLRWHPYCYWLGGPLAGEYVNIEKNGLRRTWHGGVTGNGRPVRHIFMFGGSALWGIGAPDDDTISSALTKILTKQRISAEIVNFGQVGYVSTQELILLFEQLRNGNTPDLVVFYDGFNDTASAFQNGVAGITENEVNREQEFNSFNSEVPGKRRVLYREAFVTFIRHLAIVKLAEAIFRRTCRNCKPLIQPQTPDWTPFAPHPVSTAKNQPQAVIDMYLANVRLIAKAGQQLGFRSLFYWQPVLYLRTHLSPYEAQQSSDDESVPGLKKFFVATYALARATANNIAVDRDQHIRYLGDSLPENMPCFLDSAHISGACNEAVARRMSSDIIQVLAQRRGPMNSPLAAHVAVPQSPP